MPLVLEDEDSDEEEVEQEESKEEGGMVGKEPIDTKNILPLTSYDVVSRGEETSGPDCIE